MPAALSPEVKRPEREADHSLPPIAKSKSVWSYTVAHSICLHGMLSHTFTTFATEYNSVL